MDQLFHAVSDVFCKDILCSIKVESSEIFNCSNTTICGSQRQALCTCCIYNVNGSTSGTQSEATNKHMLCDIATNADKDNLCTICLSISDFQTHTPVQRTCMGGEVCQLNCTSQTHTFSTDTLNTNNDLLEFTPSYTITPSMETSSKVTPTTLTTTVECRTHAAGLLYTHKLLCHNRVKCPFLFQPPDEAGQTDYLLSVIRIAGGIVVLLILTGFIIACVIIICKRNKKQG